MTSGEVVLHKLFRIIFSFFLLFFSLAGVNRAAAEALPVSRPVFVPANSTCSHNSTHTRTHTHPTDLSAQPANPFEEAADGEIQNASINSIGLDLKKKR